MSAMVDIYAAKYPQRISAVIFDKDGNSKEIYCGFIMEEDSKSIRVKTCSNAQNDEWDEINIPKNRSIVKRYVNI